jgi:hypothetical protein
MPWRGKRFSSACDAGENVLTRGSYWPVRLAWPLYRGHHDFGRRVYHAFTFRTSFAPSICTPAQRVFRLDYNVEGNPRLSVRRIVDELVQVDDGYYLGRMVVHWWWGRWQVTAYFALKQHGTIE